MSYVRIDIDIDMNDTKERLRDMRKRARDLKPVFRWARRELREQYTENYKEKGLMVGGWAPLDAEYSAWKFENYRFPGILVRTGDLFQGVSRLNYNEVDRDRAVFGVQGIEYARFHQTGTSKMPQRKIIFEPAGFAEKLGERTARYVSEGGKLRDMD